jgi:hypothetical protein
MVQTLGSSLAAKEILPEAMKRVNKVVSDKGFSQGA